MEWAWLWRFDAWHNWVLLLSCDNVSKFDWYCQLSGSGVTVWTCGSCQAISPMAWERGHLQLSCQIHGRGPEASLLLAAWARGVNLFSSRYLSLSYSCLQCLWLTYRMNYFSVEVNFSLYMHWTYHTPSSVGISGPILRKCCCSHPLHICNSNHPPINELAIVTALGQQPFVQTGKKDSLPEMGAVQGERNVFSTRSCRGGQQWPNLSQPRCF